MHSSEMALNCLGVFDESFRILLPSPAAARKSPIIISTFCCDDENSPLVCMRYERLESGRSLSCQFAKAAVVQLRKAERGAASNLHVWRSMRKQSGHRADSKADRRTPQSVHYL